MDNRKPEHLLEQIGALLSIGVLFIFIVLLAVGLGYVIVLVELYAPWVPIWMVYALKGVEWLIFIFDILNLIRMLWIHFKK